MSAALHIENVSVEFGGLRALSDVTLSVNSGMLIGVIGPNGAGKTTLMRAILGLVNITSGRIALNGVEISGLRTHQRVRAGLSLAQQLVQPIQDMSLLDNVALACGYHKSWQTLGSLSLVSRKKERELAMTVLARVGLSHVAERMPAGLPLGYLKRLELARALSLNPAVLLLDEPLAGLNQREAAEMANLVDAVVKGGQTTLLIEHNLREVTRICPTLYVQDSGRRVLFGETQSVISNPEFQRIYLSGNR